LLAALDRNLLRLLRTRGHWPELERAALLYARAGENGLLWQGVGAAGALVHRRRRPVYLRAMWVTALTLMANTVLKALVRRARPVLEELPALPRSPLYAAAVLMCVTRPHIGVHYPSDVVAGPLFGRALDRLL
jgi:hypothetical protein